jgi:hypothetical protein
MNPAATALIVLFCLAALALAWHTGLLLRRRGNGR